MEISDKVCYTIVNDKSNTPQQADGVSILRHSKAEYVHGTHWYYDPAAFVNVHGCKHPGL